MQNSTSNNLPILEATATTSPKQEESKQSVPVQFPPIMHNNYSPRKKSTNELSSKRRIAAKLGMKEILKTYNVMPILQKMPQLAKLIKVPPLRKNKNKPNNNHTNNNAKQAKHTEPKHNIEQFLASTHEINNNNNHSSNPNSSVQYEFYKTVPINQWYHNHNKSLSTKQSSPSRPEQEAKEQLTGKSSPTRIQASDGSILEFPPVTPLFDAFLTAADKEIIRHYLTSKSCKLFFSPRPPITDHQITGVIEAAGTTSHALALLQLLDSSNHTQSSATNNNIPIITPTQFSTMPELTESIKKLKHAMIEKRNQISDYLNNISPTIILEKEKEINPVNLDKLIDTIGYHNILNELEILHQQESSFETMSELIYAIQQSKKLQLYDQTEEEDDSTEDSYLAPSTIHSPHNNTNNNNNNIAPQSPTQQAHTLLFDWLRSAACKLFEYSLKQVAITPAHLAKTLQLTSLFSLEKQNKSIQPRIEDVNDTINNTTALSHNNNKNQRWKRLKLIKNSNSDNEDCLYELAEDPLTLARRSIRILLLMNIDYPQQFSTVDSLLETMNFFIQQLLNDKMLVYSYLFNNKRSCPLFRSQKLTLQQTENNNNNNSEEENPNIVLVQESDVDLMFGDYSDIGEGDEEPQPTTVSSPFDSNHISPIPAFSQLSVNNNNNNNNSNTINTDKNYGRRILPGIGSTRTLEILKEFESENRHFESVIELIDSVLDCRYIRVWRNRQRRGITELPNGIEHRSWKIINKEEYENWSKQENFKYNLILQQEANGLLDQQTLLLLENTQKSHQSSELPELITSKPVSPRNNNNNKSPKHVQFDSEMPDTDTSGAESNFHESELNALYRQDLLNYLSYIRLFREDTIYLTLDLLDELLNSLTTNLAKKKALKLFHILQDRAKIDYTAKSQQLLKLQKSHKSNKQNTENNDTTELHQASVEADPILSISSSHPYAGLFGVLTHLYQCERIFFSFQDLIAAIKSNIWSVALQATENPETIVNESYRVDQYMQRPNSSTMNIQQQSNRNKKNNKLPQTAQMNRSTSETGNSGTAESSNIMSQPSSGFSSPNAYSPSGETSRLFPYQQTNSTSNNNNNNNPSNTSYLNASTDEIIESEMQLLVAESDEIHRPPALLSFPETLKEPHIKDSERALEAGNIEQLTGD